MSIEAQIKADIEAARQKISDTQELYREACTVLFFRYGITPTANKLYQYVRKGSMSAPAEALGKFWADLREKSRVRIEHPDLPDTLKTAAGDLVAAVWSQAQEVAQDGLTALRAEAQAAILEAQAARASTHNELAAALKDLEQAGHSSQVAADRALQLERDLSAERASKESLASQLVAAAHQKVGLETAVAEARRDFAAELKKLREALQRSDERYEAAEKRALLEIDRERILAAKLQKELSQLRQDHLETTEQHRSEVTQLQSNLGETRQKLGVAEGALQEMRARNQHLAEQLQFLRTAAADCDTQKALLQRELEACRGMAAILEEKLKQPRTTQTPQRKRAKSKGNHKASDQV